MTNCSGCGSLLDLSDAEVRQGVEEVLQETRTDGASFPGVCPLCGRTSAPPVSRRPSVLFALLVALLAIVAALAVAFYAHRGTERQRVAAEVLRQLQVNPAAVYHLGVPVTVQGDVGGQVGEDETGWQEVRLTVPVRGPVAGGVLKVVGGRNKGEWKFTTLEVELPTERRRIDLITGRVVDLDPRSFTEAHTQAAVVPELIETEMPPARWDGEFACVSVRAAAVEAPQVGTCASPVPFSSFFSADRFEVDLRFGKFILRQADLLLDGEVPVPLVRAYTSQFLFEAGRVNAFGRNSMHQFDVAPLGSRNPYLDQMIVLPDGDFIYFSRISRGAGYADAVFRHSETSSSFRGATTRWDGNGWETRLTDGSMIHFPESYHAKNLAQGAATEMVDARGNAVRLVRDQQRNLKEVRAPGDRWIKLDHDDQARVVRAEDDRGHVVRYAYNADGMLTDVTHSDGRARHYTYVAHLLTWVRDETGRVLIHNWYEGGRVVRQDYPREQTYRMYYRVAPNNLYVEDATVELPDGRRRSFRLDESVPQWIKDIPRR